MIDQVDAALKRAFERKRANAIVWTVHWRLWGVPHGPGLRPSHCVFCGADDLMFRDRMCARCVVAARGLARLRYRGGVLPGWEMAVSEAQRALRSHPDAAAWLDERLARIGPPGDCASCGPKSPWPREKQPSERCMVCDRLETETAVFVVGPGRSVCVLCLESFR